MNKRYIAQWAKAAAVRAIKTAAQSVAASIGATALFADMNWTVAASTVLLAGVCSLLTSLAGLPKISEETESEE